MLASLACLAGWPGEREEEEEGGERYSVLAIAPAIQGGGLKLWSGGGCVVGVCATLIDCWYGVGGFITAPKCPIPGTCPPPPLCSADKRGAGMFARN